MGWFLGKRSSVFSISRLALRYVSNTTDLGIILYLDEVALRTLQSKTDMRWTVG